MPSDPRLSINFSVDVIDAPIAHRRDCCRRAWERWFTRHGIDPGAVLVPGDVTGFAHRDVENYRIRVQPFMRPGGTVTFQLEAPPLPFEWCREHGELGSWKTGDEHEHGDAT